MAGANGSFGGLRREINWDGVPDTLASPNSLPANFFNANSPRGVVFSTPGSGFQVGANATAPPIEFGNFNATYPTIFQTFSAPADSRWPQPRWRCPPAPPALFPTLPMRARPSSSCMATATPPGYG